jgi:hypothetical protein
VSGHGRCKLFARIGHGPAKTVHRVFGTATPANEYKIFVRDIDEAVPESVVRHGLADLNSMSNSDIITSCQD